MDEEQAHADAGLADGETSVDAVDASHAPPPPVAPLVTVEDTAVSLARLRMFLAPHKPHTAHHDSAPPAPAHTPSSVANPGTNETESTPPTGKVVDDPHTEERSLENDVVPPCEEADNAPVAKATEHEGNNAKTDVEIVDFSKTATITSPDCLAPPPTEAVATVSPLNPTGLEAARTRFLLECSARGFHIHDDLTMWDMRNPVQIVEFERLCGGLLQLECWVDATDLSATLATTPGSALPSNTPASPFIKISTGEVALESPPSGRKLRKQLVLCRVAVGHSFVVDDDSEAAPTIPDGYHSYYVRARPGCEATADGRDELAQKYRHNYLLTNANYVLPLFLTRFAYSSMSDKTQTPCALCEHHVAVVVCGACDASLCNTCDQDVHSANKVVSRHKRTAVMLQAVQSTRPMAALMHRRSSNGVVTEDGLLQVIKQQVTDATANLMARCRVHDDKVVEFYCPLCSVPVCVHCKMVGDHAIGDKGAHRLLSIADAYEQTLRESIKRDPLIEARRNVIEQKLQAIAQRQDDVQANHAQVASAIRQQAELALAQLATATQRKQSELAAEEIELQRQRHQLDWVDDNLHDQRQALSPVDFLATWNQYKVLRAELRDFPATSHMFSLDNIRADLQVVGQLHVVTPATLVTAISDGASAGDDSRNDSVYGARRPSNSEELRRKLMSIKTLVTDIGSGTALCPPPSLGTLRTTQGRNLVEEIRQSLVQGLPVSPTGQNNGPAIKRGATPMRRAPPNRFASLTGSNIFTGVATKRSTMQLHQPERLPADLKATRRHAWATLLQREMVAPANSSSKC